jgi:3-isopropylmalate dehydrogenase
MKFRVTLLPGDGIGPEVMTAAVKTLQVVAKKSHISIELIEKPVGGISIDQSGTPLTEDTLQTCFHSDAVLLGAVGGPKWEGLEHHLKPEAGLLKLRKSLDLYANIRPAKIFSTSLDASPLKKEILEETDFIVLRELTGGLYFGEPRGYDRDKGWNTMMYTRPEVVRIARMAFQMAGKRKGTVVSVDKANVLECSQFWRSVVREVHQDYPGIELKHMYVDNAAMQLVRNPRQFDLIVTSNMFGDILSDIAGIITGSLGMLPSASLGEKYALYEPVHGSAPDIMGQGIANPIAMILSVSMMLTHSFRLQKVADNIDTAIAQTLSEGYRTKDIYAPGDILVSTSQMTDSILNNIDRIFNKQPVRAAGHKQIRL